MSVYRRSVSNCVSFQCAVYFCLFSLLKDRYAFSVCLQLLGASPASSLGPLGFWKCWHRTDARTHGLTFDRICRSSLTKSENSEHKGIRKRPDNPIYASYLSFSFLFSCIKNVTVSKTRQRTNWLQGRFAKPIIKRNCAYDSCFGRTSLRDRLCCHIYCWKHQFWVVSLEWAS